MTIKIKLDTPAVRSLIADDTAFELELSRGVVAEIVRNLPGKLEANIHAELERQIADAMRTVAASGLVSRPAAGPGSDAHMAIHQAIKATVERHVGQQLEQAVQAAATAANERIARWELGIERVVNARIDQAFGAEVERRVALRLQEVAAQVTAETRTHLVPGMAGLGI